VPRLAGRVALISGAGAGIGADAIGGAAEARAAGATPPADAKKPHAAKHPKKEGAATDKDKDKAPAEKTPAAK